MRCPSGLSSRGTESLLVGDASLDRAAIRTVVSLKLTSRGVPVAFVVALEPGIASGIFRPRKVAVEGPADDARELPDALRLCRPSKAFLCLTLATSWICRLRVRFVLLGGGRTITNVLTGHRQCFGNGQGRSGLTSVSCFRFSLRCRISSFDPRILPSAS